LAGKKHFIDAVFFRNDEFLAVSFDDIIEIYCKVNGRYKIIKDIYSKNISFPRNLTFIDNERKMAFLTSNPKESGCSMIVLNIDE
jgi:hypothetical protein